MRKLATIVLGLPLLASCQSFGGEAEAQAQSEVVPYHVAVVVESGDDVVATPEQLQDLGVRLGEGLDARFSKVTLIPTRESEGEESGGGFVNLEGALALYTPDARAAGADLLLYAELNLAGTDHKRRGDLMAANLLLFLIGGPLSWWLGDNEYSTETNIVARYYDVNRLEKRLELFDWASASCLCQDYTANSAPMTLSFEDRMENWGDWGYRALSIVVPASFLGKDSDEAVAITEDGARRSLVESMANQVSYRKLLTSETGTFLDSSELDLLGGAGDRARLRLTLDVSQIVGRVDSRELSVGRYAAEGSPRVLEPLLETNGQRLQFEEIGDEAEGGDLQTFAVDFPSSYVTEPGSSIQVQLETSDVPVSWTFALDRVGPLDLGNPQ